MSLPRLLTIGSDPGRGRRPIRDVSKISMGLKNLGCHIHIEVRGVVMHMRIQGDRLDSLVRTSIRSGLARQR